MRCGSPSVGNKVDGKLLQKLATLSQIPTLESSRIPLRHKDEASHCLGFLPQSTDMQDKGTENSTHSFLLFLWRRERRHWLDNQPLLCHSLDLCSRYRLSDLHSHLYLSACGFTSIYHLWNTYTLSNRSGVYIYLCLLVTNTHLNDLSNVTVVF